MSWGFERPLHTLRGSPECQLAFATKREAHFTLLGENDRFGPSQRIKCEARFGLHRVYLRVWPEGSVFASHFVPRRGVLRRFGPQSVKPTSQFVRARQTSTGLPLQNVKPQGPKDNTTRETASTTRIPPSRPHARQQHGKQSLSDTGETHHRLVILDLLYWYSERSPHVSRFGSVRLRL